MRLPTDLSDVSVGDHIQAVDPLSGGKSIVVIVELDDSGDGTIVHYREVP